MSTFARIISEWITFSCKNSGFTLFCLLHWIRNALSTRAWQTIYSGIDTKLSRQVPLKCTNAGELEREAYESFVRKHIWCGHMSAALLPNVEYRRETTEMQISVQNSAFEHILIQCFQIFGVSKRRVKCCDGYAPLPFIILMLLLTHTKIVFTTSYSFCLRPTITPPWPSYWSCHTEHCSEQCVYIA